MNPNAIQSALENALADSTVRVDDLTGGGDHFQVWIVAPAFEGKSLVEQHQMVYGVLKDALGNEQIHALALKTFTPAQWEKAAGQK